MALSRSGLIKLERLLAAPPHIIRWSVRSEGHGDCAVAAISLACGVTYEQALAASIDQDRKVLGVGLSTREIRRAMKALGFSTRLRRKFDLDADTGILITIDGGTDGHAVYLWEGRILEPMHARQQLWLNPRDYLAHYKSVPSYLVVREDESVSD